MNYSLAHLKIAHYVGGQNVPFEETIETIALLERNGIIDSEGNWRMGDARPRRGLRAALWPKGRTPLRRKRRGKLSKKIVKFLQTKGVTGAHVKDIAVAIKTSPLNVRVWFYRTGKPLVTSGRIKKVAPGTFAYLKA
jgi:hypothetical protein